MAYTVGEPITRYISHVVNGAPVTGATFTVITARRGSGFSFTPTITELGSGSYQVAWGTPVTGEEGEWYLLVADAALTPDVYYDETLLVEAEAEDDDATPTPATGESGTSLGQLRLDIGSQIGDVLLGVATSASGSASQFIDAVTFVHGNNTLAGSQAICTSAANPANVGVIRTVTGNTQSTGSIDVRPDFSSAPAVGDVIEVYNRRNGGPLISEIHRAINRAIRDGAENNLVEVTDTAVTFDAEAPTFTIPASWYGFIGAEREVEDTTTWPTVTWRELDRVGRTVVIGRSRDRCLDGQNVRLRGYTKPGQLSNETDESALNPEWLINRASYHLLIATAAKKTPTEANLALGAAQAFREEAVRTQNLARPRLRTYYRLGAI